MSDIEWGTLKVGVAAMAEVANRLRFHLGHTSQDWSLDTCEFSVSLHKIHAQLGHMEHSLGRMKDELNVGSTED